MAERYYSFPIWGDTRIRHYHRTEKGKVVELVVQLEVQIHGTWRPIIRYDTAHGFGHIDRYNLKGVQRKEELHLPYDAMLTRAERDTKQNWAIYRERFLKGEFP